MRPTDRIGSGPGEEVSRDRGHSGGGGAAKRRPWLVGCLAVVLLVVGGGGVLAYRIVGRPALATMRAARDVARIPQIESRLRDQSGYTPPTNGVLTRDQVERYLRAADSVKSDLLGLGEELVARLESLEGRRDLMAVRDVAIAYADIVHLVVTAKEVQVEALNTEGFSLAEYAWVRTQVLAAAGLAPYEVDLARLSEGEVAPETAAVSSAVPEENVALVKSLSVDYEEYLPLAAFGL